MQYAIRSRLEELVKRLLLFLTLFLTIVLTLAFTSQPTQALPEYSAQTGEPCATCHISPSGGGLRTPRGQAWVGAGKPGAVPSLTEALESLGVHLEIDKSDYVAVRESVPPAEPLSFKPGQAEAIHDWLKDYEGN
jgi:mono/diheme cytochrome c family protein